MYHRILLIVFVISVLSRPVLAKESKKVEKGGYWRDKDTFVTEYSIPALYEGRGVFEDIEGNKHEFPDDNKCKEGKGYILYMSDNGTKEAYDDHVLGVE